MHHSFQKCFDDVTCLSRRHTLLLSCVASVASSPTHTHTHMEGVGSEVYTFLLGFLVFGGVLYKVVGYLLDELARMVSF